MLFNKNGAKENMTMNKENKMVELTDEQLKQVSGGKRGCPGDCHGTMAATCTVVYCPNNRKQSIYLGQQL